MTARWMSQNNLRTLSEKIVDAVNAESSDLDGIESVEEILKNHLPIQIREGISNTHVEVTKDGVVVKPSSRLLNSGEIGNIGEKHRKQIKNKWDGLGFLEGLKGHVKPNIAKLYECCASTQLNEPVVSGFTDLKVYEKEGQVKK